MPKSFVTAMHHYLDASGELPDLPAPAAAMARFLGAIVEWITIWELYAPEPTNVLCAWRRPRGTCGGRIQAGYDAESNAIVWVCPACGDEGRIHDWANTLWDRRGEAFDPPEPGETGGPGADAFDA